MKSQKQQPLPKLSVLKSLFGQSLPQFQPLSESLVTPLFGLLSLQSRE